MLPANVNINFEVTPELLAQSMALDATEKYPEADTGRDFGVEDPCLTEHVLSMGKREALRTLRVNLRAYGLLSWPDEIPYHAYQAALQRVQAW